MTSRGSLWRLDVARHIAAAYEDNPRLRAVIAGGSTARGQADEYSDLEIGVFWDDLPTEAERAAAIQKSGGDLHGLNPPDGIYLEDCFFIGRDLRDTPKSGQLVELSHIRAADLEQIVSGLATHPAADPDTLNVLSGLVDGQPLAGTSWIADLAAKARDYPEALQTAVIGRHAAIEHFWRWQMLVARGSQSGPLQAHFWSVQQRMLQCLLAVNRRYPIGDKFLKSLIDRCRISPPDFARRFLTVQTLPASRAAEELQALMHETYDLIGQRVPSLATQVTVWRHYFDYQRPFWKTAPPNLPAAISTVST